MKQNYVIYLFYINDIFNNNIDTVDEHTTVSIYISSGRVQAF